MRDIGRKVEKIKIGKEKKKGNFVEKKIIEIE